MIAAPLASFMFVQVGWRAAFLGTAAVGMLWVPLWLLVTGMRGAPAQLDARGDLQARVPVLELLRHRLVLRGFVGVLAAALPATLFHGWGAKYLVRTFAVQQADIGHYLWVPPLAMDVGAILAGDLLSRSKRELEPPRVLFAIAALCAGGIGLLQLAATPWQGTAAIAIGTFGGGAMYSLVTGDLLRRVPPDQVSTVGGVLAGAQSLMLIVANLLVGVAVDAYGNYDLVASVTAAWVVPGALVWLVWRPIPFTRSGDPPG
jgi:predicted MFS family arabinose efflux permease